MSRDRVGMWSDVVRRRFLAPAILFTEEPKTLGTIGFASSGWPDSNRRPLDPQSSAGGSAWYRLVLLLSPLLGVSRNRLVGSCRLVPACSRESVVRMWSAALRSRGPHTLLVSTAAGRHRTLTQPCRGRRRPPILPVISGGHCNVSASLSDGVIQLRVCRGRVLSE